MLLVTREFASAKCVCVCVCLVTVVFDSFVTPCMVACQAPLSMALTRQEQWSGFPSPSSGDLLNPGTEPMSPACLALAGGFFVTEPPGKPANTKYLCLMQKFQFSSVAQSCLTLSDPMNPSTPGLPVHHQLPESTQTHVHWVGDAIQRSHPLSSPSPPALNLSQLQGLFKWVSSPHQVAKVLEFQFQHQSFEWTPRTGLL